MSRMIDEWRWEVRSPVAEDGDAAEFNTAPDWIEEIQWLRGFVLYDNGRRPQFRTAQGNFADRDPLDLLAYHVLGRFGDRLVGCIRFVPLAVPVPCLTEQVLGRQRFELMLRRLDSSRNTTADVGRWVVHPDFRGHRAALSLVGGCWSYLLTLGFQTAIATVGTRAGQNSILQRAGLARVPEVPPHLSVAFDDELCAMYAVLSNPASNFAGLVRKMERRLVAVPNVAFAGWRKESA